MTLVPELLAARVPGGGAPLTIWSSLLPDIRRKAVGDKQACQPLGIAVTSVLLWPLSCGYHSWRECDVNVVGSGLQRRFGGDYFPCRRHSTFSARLLPRLSFTSSLLPDYVLYQGIFIDIECLCNQLLPITREYPHHRSDP